METSDDERDLLFIQEDEPKEKGVVGLLKARKWLLVFCFAGLLAVIIIISFVATKSSSSCSSYTDDNDCFFTGETRLPKDLKPLTYEIRLQPNLETFKFNGTVTMVVKVLKATKRIVFHRKGLNFSKNDVSVFGVMDGKITKDSLTVDEMKFDEKDEQVIIKANQILKKDHEYAIKVQDFKGNLNEKLEGFYRSSYKTNTGIRYLATTHFEATAARQAFPCFDEPAMKANFTIILVHKTGLVALSNMPEEKTTSVSAILSETRFMPSVKMSTYLVAFVVCDFKSVSNITTRGVKVRVWVPEDQLPNTKLALDSATEILDYYEQYFDIDYPLPKQDLIAIPDFSAGAMENWGLITYRLTSLLSNKKESSTSNQQWVRTVVAHELAHQWFGNLVTMKWWDDLWLNEGFASYMENVGVDKVAPELKMMDQFVVSNIQRSMHLDQLANSHPISVVVKNPDEISSLFDDISYHKGASLIYMLSTVLHEKNFLAGLRSYLKKYAFSNAATNDLWNSLSQNASNIDVKDVMDTWTLQMGFPLVTIEIKDGKYYAKQEHFLVNPGTKPSLESPFNYKWDIPLTYYTDTSNVVTEPIWMRRKNVALDITVDTGGWLKLNRDQTGYYRVNYPDENWKNLARTLQNDHRKLSAADRAGLLDDVFALARAGTVTYSTALDMSLYLDKEQDYVPWNAATTALAYVGARLSMTSNYGLYQKYILSKMTPVLDRLGYKDDRSYLERYLRDTLFGTAAYFDYKPAADTAKEFFAGFMNDNSVPPNFRYTVYDTGVRLGAKKEWEFMWGKYQAEIVAAEKKKLLSSLSATREAWLLQRCLENALNTSLIKSQDGDSVISSVARNPNGRLLAWDFFRLHYKTLKERYGSEAFSFGRLIKAVTVHFQTEFHYNEVKDFFKANPDVGTAARALQQAYESISSNIDWVKKHENEVVEWLRTHQ